MVAGTLSLIQKGQTSGFSGCSHTVDTVHSGRSGCSGCSTQWNSDYMVVGTIVFGIKSSNQWTQWTQYAVDTVE